LGDLRLDEATIHELKETGKFDAWNPQSEEDEHSLEMHLPYIYKMCDRAFESPEDFPFLVPILVGSTSAAKEKIFGKLLSSYLGDPSSVFVISSDFCHWGTRFQYTYYLPASPSGAHGRHLTRQDRTPTDPPIHESIGRIDKLAMDAVESGKHDSFLDNLKETGNTVCGRHPIGIAMAAVEELKAGGKLSKHAGLFKFVRYERSSDVENIRDSSVSYASGVAIL
jgi:AmmeMemoRadiSam system protein B